MDMMILILCESECFQIGHAFGQKLKGKKEEQGVNMLKVEYLFIEIQKNAD